MKPYNLNSFLNHLVIQVLFIYSYLAADVSPFVPQLADSWIIIPYSELPDSLKYNYRYPKLLNINLESDDTPNMLDDTSSMLDEISWSFSGRISPIEKDMDSAVSSIQHEEYGADSQNVSPIEDDIDSAVSSIQHEEYGADFQNVEQKILMSYRNLGYYDPVILNAVNSIGDSLDIRLSGETVELDLYPTLLTVKAVFWLQAGDKGAKNLTVGFPENLENYKASPLDFMNIKVNNQAVKVSLCINVSRVKYPIPGHEGAFRPISSVWWVFNVDVPPNEKVKIEISYAQGLYYPHVYDSSGIFMGNDADFYRPFQQNGYNVFQSGYIVSSGSLWKNTIGKADIILNLHGVTKDRFKSNIQPHKEEGNCFRWSYQNWEPENNFRFSILLNNEWIESVRSGPAPYNLSKLTPSLILMDRLIRFGRSRCGLKQDDYKEIFCKRLSENEWAELIAILRKGNQSEDPELKLLAHKILQDLNYLLPRDWTGKVTYDEDGSVILEDNEEELINGEAIKRCLSWMFGKEHTFVHTDSLYIQPIITNIANDKFKSIADYYLASREQGLNRLYRHKYLEYSPFTYSTLVLIEISEKIYWQRIILVIITIIILIFVVIMLYFRLWKKRKVNRLIRD